MITTAIIPAAGLGTRLSPITNAIPKELVPVYDSIALFRVCEEAVRVGIQKIIIVNSEAKPSLAEPVRRFFKQSLPSGNESGNLTVLEMIQNKPLGLGHAINCAADAIDQFPVVVMLPDVLLTESSDLLSRMLKLSSSERSVICVRTAKYPLLNRSGVVDIARTLEDGTPVRDLVEKPARGEEPSDQMIVGRYVLTEQVLDFLSQSVTSSTGEIELTDSIASSARTSLGAVVTCRLTEPYQDTGTLDGLFLAGLQQFALAKADTHYSQPVLELISLLENELGLNEN
jgi:UTP--glucose-1-phosphate uridylyltransferase